MRKIFIIVLSAFTVLIAKADGLKCAKWMYAEPGKEYMHKLVAEEGATVEGVDFGGVASLTLKDDRMVVGHRYKYVHGTAPQSEGEYTYTVKVRMADGMLAEDTVKLTVSNSLQSPTPMMGWLTWNWFAREISHDKIYGITEGLVNKGLVDAGYNTVVLDDAWATNQCQKENLTYDSRKFPRGISGFVEALHGLDSRIRVGIYSDAGVMTCENYQPGSYGFEREHIALFDSWGIDMLKYDFCNSETTAFESYKPMGEAVAELNAQRKKDGRRPFVLNICEWGSNEPWTWAADAGGSSWRSTSDARECWLGSKGLPGVLAGADCNRDLWMWAGVNRYNDLDMMVIGLHGLGGPSNYTEGHYSNGGVIEGLTHQQAQSQMSLWCMMGSPLSLTCDLRSVPRGEANKNTGVMPVQLVTDNDIAILTNPRIIAIDQDALGQQAEYMEMLSTSGERFAESGIDVYVKDLTGGRKAVSVTNRGDVAVYGPVFNLSDLYLSPKKKYMCTEVWNGKKTTIKKELKVQHLVPFETKVFLIE